MNKIRLISLFSGYDSQALSMERLKRDFPNEFDYELVAWCEIDNAAIKAHNALFPQWSDRNMGDICKLDPKIIPDCDVITWSFPCQAISNAGKQAGLKEGSGTTSSLAWECIKIFKEKRPKYLLMENVAAICQKKFKDDFAALRKAIEDLGYVNYWELKNSKDFGVPQNRLRCFMVSILRTKDEPKPTYNFPKGFPLNTTVEDYMVDADLVGEEYYISQERVTSKVLSDILDQPNVRAEMEKLYHEEWKERMINKESILVDPCPADKRYLFESAEWESYEEGSENLSPHFDIFRVIIKDGAREISVELRIDVWYQSKDRYSEIIAQEVNRLIRNYPISNHKELEDKILTILNEKYFKD